MKKITFLVVILLLNIVGYSQTIQQDGIVYNKINDSTLEVGDNSTFIGIANIPETILYNDTSYVVTKIAQYAFYNSSIEGISLPNTLTIIDTGAFSSCLLLDSISIPDSVYKIGFAAFQYDVNLKYIKLPFKLLIAEEITFNNCEQLETVIFNPNLEKIENIAFSCCYALANINLPESVTTIEDSAFFNCGLQTVMFAPQQINNYAFGDCYQLNKIYSKIEIPPTISLNTFVGISPEAKVFVCGNPVDYKNTTWGTVFDTITEAPINLCNLGLNNILNNNELNIYPNPLIENTLTIKSTSNGLKKGYLYSSNGKLVNSILFRNYTKVNIETSGIYFLKIDNQVQKIVKL